MPELKNNGALRTAQKTTNNRISVTTDKLLCLHGTVDETLNELELCNYWYGDWEGIKNSKKIDSFGVNVDETSISSAYAKLLYS